MPGSSKLHNVRARSDILTLSSVGDISFAGEGQVAFLGSVTSDDTDNACSATVIVNNLIC